MVGRPTKRPTILLPLHHPAMPPRAVPSPQHATMPARADLLPLPRPDRALVVPPPPRHQQPGGSSTPQPTRLEWAVALPPHHEGIELQHPSVIQSRPQGRKQSRAPSLRRRIRRNRRGLTGRLRRGREWVAATKDPRQPSRLRRLGWRLSLRPCQPAGLGASGPAPGYARPSCSGCGRASAARWRARGTIARCGGYGAARRVSWSGGARARSLRRARRRRRARCRCARRGAASPAGRSWRVAGACCATARRAARRGGRSLAG